MGRDYSVGTGEYKMLNIKSLLLSASIGAALAVAVVAPAAAGDSNGNFQIKLGGTFVDFDNKTNSLTSSVAGDILTGIPQPLKTRGCRRPRSPTMSTRTWPLSCSAAPAALALPARMVWLVLVEIAHFYTFPPALTLQYHLDPIGPLRPYAGVGVEWICTWGGKGSNGLGADSVKVGDFVGFVLQGGVDFDLGNGFSLGVDVKKVLGQ